MTKNQSLDKFFDTLRCGFSPFHETSGTTRSNGSIHSTIYRRDPIFKKNKIQKRLGSDHLIGSNITDTNSIKAKSLQDVIHNMGGRVGVSAGGFPKAFAIAELGASIDSTNRRSSEIRYSHYSYEVQKYRWTLPPLSELRREYTNNKLFKHLASVEEAMNFMEAKGFYYIDEIILGGRVSYSCRVEETNKIWDKNGNGKFFDVVAGSASIAWNVENSVQSSMQISNKRVRGGDPNALSLEAWTASLNDIQKLNVIRVSLKPISHLISDVPTMAETKKWLERALEIRTSYNKYFEYCFKMYGSIKCYSAFDPSVSIQAEYVGTTTGTDGVVVNIKGFPSQKFKFSGCKHDGDVSIFCIQQLLSNKTGKFLCARSKNQTWMSVIIEWIYGDRLSPEKSNSNDLLDLQSVPRDGTKEWIFEATETTSIRSLPEELNRVLIFLFWWLAVMTTIIITVHCFPSNTNVGQFDSAQLDAFVKLIWMNAGAGGEIDSARTNAFEKTIWMLYNQSSPTSLACM